MSLVTSVPIKRVNDIGGSITVYEPISLLQIDFKRIYFLNGIKNEIIRGNHAHKKLQQFFIVLKGFGSFRFMDGKSEQEIVVDEKSDFGLYVPSGLWREIKDVSTDFVLIVYASDMYDESDYIRNWDDFISWKAKTHESLTS